MREPIKFGDYYLFERVAVGGMAEVFKGVSYGVEGFERLFAVKRVLPNIAEDQEFVDMFIDEAKIAVQLSHANIGQIYELGKVDGSYFIAMEFVQGRDLRAIFDQARAAGRHLDIPMCCHIVKEVCEALEYAHNKKRAAGEDLSLVHRDVSPQNIICSYDGEVKLIDFGIAKAAGKASKTQAGILKGKFGYMSPEQVRGRSIDRRTDLFSLAAVLYELLTLERCFQGESDFSTLDKVRKVDIRKPSSINRDIPPELERIILTGLAREPEDRYQSAAEFQDALQKFLYTTGEFYARKDLGRYMRHAFQSDLERETARLAAFREYARQRIPEALRASSAPRRTEAPPAPPEEAFRGSRLAANPGARPAPPSQEAVRPAPPAPEGFSPSAPSMEWEDEELETAVWDRSPSQILAGLPEPPPGHPARKGSAGDDPPAFAAAAAQMAAARSGRAPTPGIGPPPLPRASTHRSSPAVEAVRTSGTGMPAQRPATNGRPHPSGQFGAAPLNGSGQFGAVSAGAISAPRAPRTSTQAPVLAADDPRNQPTVDVVPPNQGRWRLWGLATVVLLAIGVTVYFLRPQADLGGVTFETDVATVLVSVDDGPATERTSPVRISGLSPGHHRIRIAGAGRQQVDRSVEIAAGAEAPLGLIPLPTAITGLEIDTVPGGARVYIDDELVDETPLRADKVRPGVRRLRIEKDGYLSWNGTVEAAQGAVRRVEKIALLPAQVTVTLMADPKEAEIFVVSPDGARTRLGTGTVRHTLDNRGQLEVVAELAGYRALRKRLPQYAEPSPGRPELLNLEAIGGGAPATPATAPPAAPATDAPPAAPSTQAPVARTTPRRTPVRRTTPEPTPRRAANPSRGGCRGEDCPDDGDDEPVARRTIVITPPPETPPAAPATRAPAVARGNGYLNLQARPAAKAFIGGRLVGWTPLIRHEMPAGTHDVELVREGDSPYRRTITVLIEPDKTTLRKFEP